jgi:hypothetical protein
MDLARFRRISGPGDFFACDKVAVGSYFPFFGDFTGKWARLAIFAHWHIGC